MKCSRRDFGLLLPTLAVARQAIPDNSVEKLPRLGTHAYIFESLEVTTNGQNRQRRMS